MQQSYNFCHDLPTSSLPELGRILVTGTTGYIGGRLVPELLARGYQVRAMVRGSAPEVIKQCLRQKRHHRFLRPVTRIGGKEGWFRSNFLWLIRGWCARILMGVGVSRARTKKLRHAAQQRWYRLLAC